MIKSNLIEALVGALVLGIASFFIIFSYSSSRWSSVDGYTLTAKFNRADGINVGTPVRLSGVKVGRITSITLDPQTYQAVVSFQLDSTVKVPADSTAQILGDGLLGSKFLSLVPGGASKMLSSGAEVKYTQSSVSFESLIGQFIFNTRNEEEKKSP